VQNTVSSIVVKDWKTYKNETYGYEIPYPSDFALKNSNGGITFLPEIKDYFTTILVNEVSIGVDAPAKICATPESAQKREWKDATFDGQSFSIAEWTDAAAGSRYQEKIYRTIHNNLCYQITLNARYAGSYGLYASNQQKIEEVDARNIQELKAFTKLFDKIATSIKFTK
jgi:hypothetical protein